MIKAEYEIYQIEVADMEARNIYQRNNKSRKWYANQKEHLLFLAHLRCEKLPLAMAQFAVHNATILTEVHPVIGEVYTIELKVPVKL